MRIATAKFLRALGAYPPGVWLTPHAGVFLFRTLLMTPALDRAIVFVDGNNWYHSLHKHGVDNLGLLNFAKISRKLLGPRDWIATRYYVGQVQQTGNTTLYAAQRRFFSFLRSCDPRISYHLGRLEPRVFENEAAKELRRYLSSLKSRIDVKVFKDLMRIAKLYGRTEIVVEKAVDVMLAVDLVVLAERNAYDTAYLLTADGDYTPAVQATRAGGKKVYAVSMSPGAQLAAVVNSYIRIDATWVVDCFGNP